MRFFVVGQLKIHFIFVIHLNGDMYLFVVNIQTLKRNNMSKTVFTRFYDEFKQIPIHLYMHTISFSARVFFSVRHLHITFLFSLFVVFGLALQCICNE